MSKDDQERKYVDSLVGKIGAMKTKYLKEDHKYGRFTLSGLVEEEKVILKIVRKDDAENLKRVHKEVYIDKILNHYLGDPAYNLEKTAVISSGQDGSYYWFVRKYAKGIALAEPDGATPNYDTIGDNFLSKTESIISQISRYENGLRIIPAEALDPQYRSERFKTNISEYNLDLLQKNVAMDLTHIIKFYESNSELYLKGDNSCFSMGDLVPSNIIITDDGAVLIIDYEWFSIDNKMADISFFWLYLWKYPEWQEKWLNDFIKTRDDQISFQMSVIRQIIGFWADAGHYQISNSKRNEYNKKCLLLADNFEKLIMTKYDSLS